MNLKPGDKVKFLNATGGGIVTRIIDTRMVSVAVEGGFDMPTLMSELVKVENDLPGGRYFDEPFKVDRIPEPEEEGRTGESDRMTELPVSSVKNRKSEEILLCFFPHDQKWLISGLVDIYLINNSGYDLLYNLYLSDLAGGFAGKDYGSLFPDSKLLIETVPREDISRWTNGYLQLVFHIESVKEVLPPFNSEFRIDGQKFSHEGSYRESSFIPGKALQVRVLSVTDFIESHILHDR